MWCNVNFFLFYYKLQHENNIKKQQKALKEKVQFTEMYQVSGNHSIGVSTTERCQ